MFEYTLSSQWRLSLYFLSCFSLLYDNLWLSFLVCQSAMNSIRTKCGWGQTQMWV